MNSKFLSHKHESTLSKTVLDSQANELELSIRMVMAQGPTSRSKSNQPEILSKKVQYKIKHEGGKLMEKQQADERNIFD